MKQYATEGGEKKRERERKQSRKRGRETHQAKIVEWEEGKKNLCPKSDCDLMLVQATCASSKATQRALFGCDLPKPPSPPFLSLALSLCVNKSHFALLRAKRPKSKSKRKEGKEKRIQTRKGEREKERKEGRKEGKREGGKEGDREA